MRPYWTARLLGTALVGLLALSGCADDSSQGQPDLSVTGAQLVVLEDGEDALLAMTISSSAADELVKVELADAPFTQLSLFREVAVRADSHQPAPKGPLTSIRMAADTPIVFGADGYGAVLEGLPSKDAATVRLTLAFAHRDPIDVIASVAP